jgi:DNA-3-methyladenine glycosylase
MSAAAGATADTQRAPPAPDADIPTSIPTPVPFGREWYERDPVALAQVLLGQLVVRDIDGERRMARIVETEAYAGTDDRASHARAGRTRRTEPMYGPAGHAYVYLVYGLHHCLNVVAGTEGVPSAVLIRAAEPVAGAPAMRRARHDPRVLDARLLAGPALVCAGMSIDRGLDGHDLTTGHALWIGADSPDAVADAAIVRGPRIGVDYAGPGWADRPWRFGLAANAALSRPFPTSVRASHPAG